MIIKIVRLKQADGINQYGIRPGIQNNNFYIIFFVIFLIYFILITRLSYMKLFSSKTESFTELYNTYYPLIYSVVNSKVNNADDTEDICQEVFIRYFEKVDEVESPRKWLYGTLRNVVSDYYRKKKGKTVNVDDLFNDISFQYVNGFRDTRILIQEAFDNMNNFKDEKDKILFDLVAVYNFTYSETGEQLGLSVRQVRYRYGLIVKTLLDYFKQKGINSLEELL